MISSLTALTNVKICGINEYEYFTFAIDVCKSSNAHTGHTSPPPLSPVVEYNRVYVKMIINRKMYKYNPEYVGDISGAGSLTSH